MVCDTAKGKEQTMSKDTIYREDAIKAINLRARIPHDVASAMYASMAINAIYSVPSADRPSGKWIRHENPRYSYEREQGDINAGVYYTCSECNCISLTHKYCPNCGAKMDGERKTDD